MRIALRRSGVRVQPQIGEAREKASAEGGRNGLEGKDRETSIYNYKKRITSQLVNVTVGREFNKDTTGKI